MENFDNVSKEALEQAKQIPKAIWWRDMLEILRRAPLTNDEILEAFSVIVLRMHSAGLISKDFELDKR
jgi:hypothetical protein